jgi:integrase
MASIDRRADGRWRARWREYPGGPQRTRHFARKADAQRFLVDTSHRLLSGTYTPPSAGQMTVAAYAEEWVRRRTWAPSTHERVRRELDRYVLPAIGDRPLASLRRPHIEEWAKALPLAPSTAERVYQTLSGLLSAAVEDERIPRNPAKGARVAKADRPPFVPLTGEQVRALASAVAEPIRAGVLLAAGTGLRQGELFGLTVDRVDFMRRELRVDRQLWTPDRGPAVLKSPKSAKSYRTIALSQLVVDSLVAHVAIFRPNDEGFLFHADGRPVDRATAWRWIDAGATRAGLKGHAWHDLRHHHATVLLSRGVSPALVAERLGHDVATLLKTYAHVIRSDDDRVRAIVDETLADSAEDFLRTNAV